MSHAMSAAPAKSQSFRSFSSLSLPTWGTQATAATAAADVEPKLETEAERSSSAAVANRGVGSRSSRQQRFSFSSLAPSSVKPVEESQKGLRDAAAHEEKPPPPPLRREEVPVVKKEVNEGEGAEEEEEEVKRTWNLRPRKGCSGSRKNNNGVFSPEACGGGKGNGGASEAKQQKSGGGIEPKSNRLRGLAAESPGLGGAERKNENLRLWIALSRDEIEEDIFSMSGNRPSRRPRKRPKTVQKHMDIVFPGMCLVGMNADSFRVADAPAKK